MTLKFQVQGLGKIEDAEINISPLTVITGPNGTGKSFFTKVAYSLFKMIEDSSSLESTKENAMYAINTCISGIEENFKHFGDNEIVLEVKQLVLQEYLNNIELYDKIIEISDSTPKEDEEKGLEKIHRIVIQLIESTSAELSEEPFDNTVDLHPVYQKLNTIVASSPLDEKHLRMIRLRILGLNNILMLLLATSSNNEIAFSCVIEDSLEREILNNFQIQSLSEITNRKDAITFNCEGLFDVSIKDNKVSAHINSNSQAIELFRKKSSSIFFESPAYWRVRDALVNAKLKSGNEFLTGAPKYFFDLDTELRAKNTFNSELLEIYESIKMEIGGEFEFKHGEISFQDNSINKSISKNLVSFGMTNLGMVNALIKNNVIKKGSYVFIDEPETNLHPDWQVLMIQSLVALSKAGVNVIITTHSTEILKYIEVAFSKIKEDEGEEKVKELLSINYLDTDGTSLEFDSECPIEQTKEALLELSSPFLKLYMEGA